MHGCFTPIHAADRCAPERKGHAWRQRELRALLQQLAAHDGWLAQEARSQGAQWWLHAPAVPGARSVRPVPDDVVAALKERDFLVPLSEDDPLRWRISARGRRWLAACLPGMKGIAPRKRPGEAGTREEVSADAAPRPPKKATRRLLVRDAETGRLREVEVNLRENPLMWLARRKDAQGRPYLEPHHVASGEKLRRDFETASMQPKITASWNAALVASDRSRLKSGPRDPYPFTDMILTARQRVHRALEAIGPELADVVLAVCCLGHGIEAAERALSWPRRSARLVLRIALERLAAHYGLRPVRDDAAPRWRSALTWHAEDGRPVQAMPAQAADCVRETDRPGSGEG